jgi:nucleotide-binding universal stress UspA family protein
VHVVPTLDPWSAGCVPGVLEQLDEAAWAELARARDVAAPRVGGEVRTTLVHDHPRSALLAAGRHADLLVTGARRRNRLRAGLFGGFQLGSTSLFAAAHAPCPVAVVRGPAAEGARDVVVGFDGSPAAAAAARWAAGHAAATGGRVRVVAVRHGGAHLDVGVEDLLARLREEEPRVEVAGTVVEGAHPEDVLLAAAGRCALLVVGSRGHGAVTSALVGSTGHAVLHRAGTPVVVVPDARQVTQRRRQSEHSLVRP